MREFDLDHNDDMFADTRMSFGEHIEELRTYLIRAILGFCVAMGVSFLVGRPVLREIIIKPVEEQLQAIYDVRYNEIKQDIWDKLTTNEGTFVRVTVLEEPIKSV